MKPKTIIRVVVSDPWEFYEDNDDSNIFYADIVDYAEDCILFYSHKSIMLRSKTGSKLWRYFIGTPRHAENHIDEITLQDGCFCGVIAVTDGTVSLPDARQQASAWRGGGVFIGSIKELQHTER
jgi:hypothetical protein